MSFDAPTRETYLRRYQLGADCPPAGLGGGSGGSPHLAPE